MKLSIIIVNFDTKDFLRECLLSIFKGLKRSKLNFDVIVVDNGSKEKINSLRSFFRDCETKNQIAKIKNTKFASQSSFGAKNSEIKLIENKDNLGFAKANNQGIKVAKGEYILLLNPDTIVPRKALPFMIDFMERNKNVGVATCRVELPSRELDDACHRGFPTPWNAFCHFFGLGRLFSKSKFFNGYHLGYQNMGRVHEIDACAGAFLLARRIAGEEVGWLDEDYFWYGEDLDLCFRVKKAGWKIMFVPNVKIIHYKGVASGIKKNSFLISKASKETKILATKARFDVMKLFYDKHFKEKYPKFLRWVVLRAIEIKRKIALFRI